MKQLLERRALGGTGLEVSLLGLGGFHQVEASQATVDAVVAAYLEAGGNYVETARSYGAGASEQKLGRALSGVPREHVLLASKTTARSRSEVLVELEASLTSLSTDYLDLYFFHGVNRMDELEAILAPDGALAAFEESRRAGRIRHIGLSSHWPAMYLEAARRLPLDAVLIWGNYLDFCNFPEIPEQVLPALRRQGIGVLFMKPLADGFLYRSPEAAFRYALAQDGDCLVSGFNSPAMLAADVAACHGGAATPDEAAVILRDAPELGRYVCRQCPTCTVCAGADGTALKRLFELEGKVDRQMDDWYPVDAAQYALRERLKGWFASAQRARALYAAEGRSGERLARLASAAPCRYGIEIQRKIALAHAKLTDPQAARLL